MRRVDMSSDDLDPTRQAFLEEMLERVLAAEDIESAEPLQDVFGLRVRLVGDETPRMIFLDNLFGETRDFSDEERERRVELFVRAMCEKPEEDPGWDGAAGRLLPVLRTVGYLALPGVPLQRGTAGGLVSRSFVPFVRLGVALDSELTMRMVKTDDLERWERSQQAVLDRAIGNLADAETELERAVLPDGSAVFRVATDDSYESSRLALPGWLGSFRDRVQGRPIAAVPERAQCIVTGDGSEEAVRYLLEVAEREWNASPRAISPALYTVTDDDAVVPFRLGGGELTRNPQSPEAPRRDENTAAVARGHVLLALREYEEQTRALEQRYEEEGLDVWVATPFGIVAKDVGPITVSVWPEAVTGLLPVVDRLVFQREEGAQVRFVTVAWKDALRIAGRHLAVEAGLEPARHRILGFPSPEELEALEAVALEVDVRERADDEDDDENGEGENEDDEGGTDD